MASFQFDVKTYCVTLGPACGYSVLRIEYPAIITCFDRDKRYRCNFRFAYPPLPDSRYDAGSRIADVFVPAEQYSWYVDLLRNERPVRCTINSDTPKLSTLSTLDEPVGEGEVAIGF